MLGEPGEMRQGYGEAEVERLARSQAQSPCPEERAAAEARLAAIEARRAARARDRMIRNIGLPALAAAALLAFAVFG